jgi:hypothetical protein
MIFSGLQKLKVLSLLLTFWVTLRAWVVYQNIALLRSHGSIVEGMREVFGYSYSMNIASNFKSIAAKYLEPTYQQLINKLRSGQLIHADETKVSVKGKTGYVWTFTNLEEVIYVYTETREGSIISTIIGEFNGVLVSDFYSAYDSLMCAQQKCLIHLIRDLNDDLFKNPFDDDLKKIASSFTELLGPIIESIDRYGLKKHHLKKYEVKVQCFFRMISQIELSSDIARGYLKRFNKYKDKLFTFLKHDGVPWNNNNAENAIKHFAFLRRMIGGSSTPKGLNEYLILLSIRETLRRKNRSFLEFLKTQQTDLDIFLKEK